MKKIITTCLMLMWMISFTFGQFPLTGSKTIPGDYPSLEMAINALNNYGVGAGGVTFNIAAGFVDTLSSTANGRITATGTESDPIIFQKSGSGNNPLIISPVGFGQYDGMISLVGASYITFDGIDLTDRYTNSTTTLAMEWGFGLFKPNGAQGSQRNTIKNCNITFNGISHSNVAQGYGILSRSTNGETGTAIAVTALSGTNSYNSFYNNTMTNINGGIYLDGYNAPAPYTFYDQGNNIGGDETAIKSGELGNSITNWKYHAIYGSYQNNITVAGNILFGNVSSGLQISGIRLMNMNNGSFSVHDNTISADFISTSGSSISLMYCETANGTDNITEFYNNSIINSSIKTSVVNNNTIHSMYVKGGYLTNIYGNTISGNTYGDNAVSSQNTIYFMSLGVSQNVPGLCNIYNNSVTGNIRKINYPPTDTQAFTWLMSLNGNNGVMNCHDNVLSDNSGLVLSQAQLVTINASGITVKFYNNTISNYESRGFIYGLNLMGASDKYVYNNKISNITTWAGDKYIYGVISQGTTTNNHILYNNYISELKAPNSNSTAAILGIYAYTGNTSLYNNTIYLNATTDTVTTNYGTAGIFMGPNTNVRFDVRNNIVVNTSTHMGTGFTSALRLSSTALPISAGNYLTTCNNNLFYAGLPTAGNYIFYQTATMRDSTLEAFKSRAWPMESASVSELPPFENILAAPYDLHLKNNVPTQCESGASIVSTPVEVNSDFDGQPRFPNAGYPDNPITPATAPDMGADEFDGLKIDITPPTISFTPLGNTIETTERMLTTTITDGTGVPTSGIGLPVLYWKKMVDGSWNSVQATWITPNTYTFTFGGGANLGDSIYYYIMAQDLVAPVPNVGASPFLGATGFTANPPACAVPPADSVLMVYKIVAPVCGTYEIGVGKDFETLSEAFTEFISRPITCPVTLLLTDATYPTQTYPITVPQFTGISATNTLTIKPAPGIAPLFSSSSASGIFNFNGAKHIILDGSNSGGSDKSLTFINTATTANAYALGFVNADVNKSTNCVVKNCVIKASSQVTNSTYGIFFSPTVGGYGNILIDNNTICSARIGISLSGASAESANDVQITNNIIGSSIDAEAIQFQGIWINYANNTLIRGNEIMGAYAGNTNTSMDGIYLGTGAAATKIRQNEIHNFNAPNGSINTVDAINLFTGSATTVTEISNNLIYGIKGKNGSVGINIASGGNVLIANNTVSLTDSSFNPTATSTRFSACLRIASGVTLLDVRNNIFQNTQQCIDPLNQSPLTYAVYSSSAASAFTNINYNNYFVNDAAPLSGLSGRIGYLGSARTTLANWQSATLQDANSLNVNPVFISATDLHTAAPALNNAGVSIPSVLTDYDGTVRTNPPDVGAYEFVLPIANLTTLDTTDVGFTTATLHGEIHSAGEVVNLSFEYGKTDAYGNNIAADPTPIRSLTAIAFSADLTGLQQGTLYHYRAKGVSTTSAEIVYGEDKTFITLSDVPVNTSVTNVTVVTGVDTCFNATSTITVAGNNTTFVIQNGGSATMIAGEKILYLPGTLVEAGGYMLGYITLTNEYCGAGDASMVAVKRGVETTPPSDGNTGFKLYPNPTSGSFTLEFTGSEPVENSSAFICDIHGTKILDIPLSGQNKQVISLENQPKGMYFIRILNEKHTTSTKILKH